MRSNMAAMFDHEHVSVYLEASLSFSLAEVQYIHES